MMESSDLHSKTYDGIVQQPITQTRKSYVARSKALSFVSKRSKSTATSGGIRKYYPPEYRRLQHITDMATSQYARFNEDVVSHCSRKSGSIAAASSANISAVGDHHALLTPAKEGAPSEKPSSKSGVRSKRQILDSIE